MRPWLPVSLVERILRLSVSCRRKYLAKDVPESPPGHELQPDFLYIEIRGGHLKWVHFSCPRCGEHIQLPMAGKDRWSLKLDIFRRPTLEPSIWETESCGAHFFVRRGNVIWCHEATIMAGGSSGSSF